MNALLEADPPYHQEQEYWIVTLVWDAMEVDKLGLDLPLDKMDVSDRTDTIVSLQTVHVA